MLTPEVVMKSVIFEELGKKITLPGKDELVDMVFLPIIKSDVCIAELVSHL